jgi:hypothetical protein
MIIAPRGRSGEVSEEVINFFVGVDAMLTLDDVLEGWDHP